MVGKTALMQLGSLLLKLRSRPLACGFLLGHASTTLGKLGLLASLIRRATMLAGDLLTPLPQLTLAGANPRTFTRSRHKQRKRNHYISTTTTITTISAVDIHHLHSMDLGTVPPEVPAALPVVPNNPRQSDPGSRRSVVMTTTADRSPHSPQQNQRGADYDQNDPDHPQDRDLRDKANQQQDNAQNNHKPSPTLQSVMPAPKRSVSRNYTRHTRT
jgi:hypothetical protein